ncbi:unnamed protein product [Rotaria magnacalcarata]|uniref:Calponin-homology (CH) domain-containing protein n=1 Tax=Rotaria magnacalcarata TaxID=392030 RepID=A0A819F551_9BILA|nr:unnamed protein product [Rotaria magnacalcarata]CAF1608622.1 unnamed protein product [Rotaria magnacalcarata]CAF2057609.1 unnamed protein product [Rotaria magnacalcarata]CAF2110406.1 unnamed protein product [Rotaria magnacalcarata]CAF2151208.1 unnamed protein product [Rotaria magnacalcarata]
MTANLRPSYKEAQERLLKWCQNVTRNYESVKIRNFTSDFADGLAFCAIVHHYFPDAFDFNQLNRNNKQNNFDLAFRTAEEKAQIHPLLDSDDLVKGALDKKCVFTYLLTLYHGLKNRESMTNKAFLK